MRRDCCLDWILGDGRRHRSVVVTFIFGIESRCCWDIMHYYVSQYKRYAIDQSMDHSDPRKLRQREDCRVALELEWTWTGAPDTLTEIIT